MTKFTIHDTRSAPDASRQLLQDVEKKYGFVPNLMGIMAEAPPLLAAYLNLSKLLERTTLTPAERQILLLTISETNACEYCVAAHTLGAQGAQVDGDIITKIRQGGVLSDSKLEALRQFTRSVVADRGWPGSATVTAFYEAGYTRANLLEVILAVGMKTLSNYTNHLAATPLDSAFKDAEWRSPVK